jgi:hypothetical protein
MPKTDLKKQLKEFYTASTKKPSFVDVPKLKYLMIDGSGDPNTNTEFSGAMNALYGVAYTLKFGPAKLDFSVMLPEGLWWTKGDARFDMQDKASWQWTLMMVVPDVVSAAMVREAKKAVKEKKGLARVDDLRLESWREGPAVQIMHIGPYSQEAATIEKLHQFAAENGYALSGKHHEIYFSDPRRTKPEKLKTLLRQPVKRAD